MIKSKRVKKNEFCSGEKPALRLQIKNRYLLSMVAGMFVLLLVVFGYMFIEQEYHERIDRQIEIQSRYVRESVVHKIKRCKTMLEMISKYEDEQMIRSQALQYLEDGLCVQSVFYGGLRYELLWDETNELYKGVDCNQVLSHYSRSNDALFALNEHGSMIAMVIPVKRDGETVGYLGGIVSVDHSLVGTSIDDVMKQYVVRVEFSEEEAVSVGAGVRTEDGGVYEAKVAVDGQSPVIRVTPTADFLKSVRHSESARYLLYYGLCGAFVICVLVYYIQSKVFMNTVSQFATAQLDVEISEREEAIEMAKQASTRLRDHKQALDHFAIVAETDAKGTITYVNEMFCEVSGYSAEEMIGQNHRMLNSGHHPKSFFVEMWRTISSGKPWRGEIKNRAKDGSYYWVDTSIFPFLDSEGKVEQYLAIRRVITDRKEQEEAIRKANEELAMANDEMERFVYTASHDLKSPIVTIRGFIGHLKQDVLNERTDRVLNFVDRIEAATLKMQSHIDDLLDLSRIGRVRHESEEIEIGDLVVSIVHDHIDKVKDKHAKVVVEPQMPVVYAVREQMVQVFDNLIVNALKYGCSGESPEIRIGSKVMDDDIAFYVEDNGQGIAAEYQSKIFELFQRLETKENGTGVGLALVKRVMELNKGIVWVESEPGHGAKFWVSFPKQAVQHGR